MTANAGVDVGRGDSFSLWVRVKTALATMETNMEFPQNARNRLTHDLATVIIGTERVTLVTPRFLMTGVLLRFLFYS